MADAGSEPDRGPGPLAPFSNVVAHPRRKGNHTVNRRIEGGTVHKVSKGDFLLIPENVPHQVTAFSPELYMVTFEYPRGVKAP